MPLLQELSVHGHQLKGSTTSRDKLRKIEEAGGKAYLFEASPEGRFPEEVGDFFDSDLVIITIPPPKSLNDDTYAVRVHRSIASACIDVPQVILFSSTSVYPDLNREIVEEDALAISSPHSGVVMLDIENAYHVLNGAFTILRFGGLFGYDRRPGDFLHRTEVLRNSEAPVNMTHRDDMLGAVEFIISNEVPSGVYNLCSPVHPTRAEFYQAAQRSLNMEPTPTDGQKLQWKEVSVRKMLDAGYTFLVEDPLSRL